MGAAPRYFGSNEPCTLIHPYFGKSKMGFGKIFTASGEDLLARAFCHELDHLDGILFVDLAEEIVEEKE